MVRPPDSTTFTIAHLSDLHCGGQYFVPGLLERAISELNDMNPDIVVCSGDLTTFGFKHEYEEARRYLDILQGWLPAAQAGTLALAVSDERGAQETLAAFRLTPEPSVLVTVAMAYEGLDAPEVAVVAALTHVRSRPWLEQMVARATRVEPSIHSSASTVRARSRRNARSLWLSWASTW